MELAAGRQTVEMDAAGWIQARYGMVNGPAAASATHGLGPRCSPSRRRDVRTRLKVGGAEDVIRDQEWNLHLGPALDERLDLSLPLRADKLGWPATPGSPPATTPAQQPVQWTPAGTPSRYSAAKMIVPCSATMRAAALMPFYALVQVHVERIPGVGGHDDIERLLHPLHCGGSNEFASRPVGFIEVAREQSGDGAMFIEGDIQREARAG